MLKNGVFCSCDIEKVQSLIQSKVDVNESDYDARTPMHLVITVNCSLFFVRY